MIDYLESIFPASKISVQAHLYNFRLLLFDKATEPIQKPREMTRKHADDNLQHDIMRVIAITRTVESLENLEYICNETRHKYARSPSMIVGHNIMKHDPKDGEYIFTFDILAYPYICLIPG